MIKHRIVEEFERHKKLLSFALAATFLWGILAHGYCFFDNSFSHDSLEELHGAVFGTEWKVALGRVFVPIYRDIFRGDATLPWLIGALSLFWIGLSVFFTCLIFHIRSKPPVFLIAGIFTTNISVSATAATYLHDLDCYMFSFLIAVLAVYLWRSFHWGFIAGSVFVTVSLGLYQSFISIVITFAMIICIFDLLDGNSFKTVFFAGIKAIAMILLGGILYFIAMKLIQRMMDIPLLTGDYNTLDLMLKLTPQLCISLIREAYTDWFTRLMSAYSAYPAFAVKIASVLLLVSSSILLFNFIMNKSVRFPERLLCILLVALLPLGMNIIYVLTTGNVHDLMVFGIWQTYLLILLLHDRLTRRLFQYGRLSRICSPDQWVKGLCGVLIALLLYGNVQFSNGMYLKKDMEYDAYLSLMTRVSYRMEAHPEYIPGETPVFFTGRADNLNPVIPGFKEYQNVIGMEFPDVIMGGKRIRYQRYFDYILGTPIKLASEDTWYALEADSRILEMSAYPGKDCISMIDGILVVKLG